MVTQFKITWDERDTNGSMLSQLVRRIFFTDYSAKQTFVLIPITGEKGQHSPDSFFPLLLYTGKEDFNSLLENTQQIFLDLKKVSEDKSKQFVFVADLKSMMTVLKLSVKKEWSVVFSVKPSLNNSPTQ